MVRLINWGTALGFRICCGLIPRSLISFLIVGSLGMLVHLAIMQACMSLVALPFALANLLAMVGAASFNYYLNNQATFTGRALRGRSVLIGYVLYMAVTSLGLSISMAVSSLAYAHGYPAILSAMAGIVSGTGWNYLMSYTFVWRLMSRFTARAPA